MDLTRDQQLAMHRSMVRIRLFEETAGKLMETGRMPGFLHLYVGQEAVACVVRAGAAGAALTENAVLAVCRERLGPTKSPLSVVFVAPDLPRSASGKVALATLKEQIAAERAAAAQLSTAVRERIARASPQAQPGLLVDVIGLDWELVHAEACRWEHVMSETVERRLIELLDHPTESPYGNPIPGLDELGDTRQGEEFMDGVTPLSEIALTEEARVHVRRISEEMQKDEVLMGALRRVGAVPDKTVTVARTEEGVLVGSGGETAEIVPEAAEHIFVRVL